MDPDLGSLLYAEASVRQAPPPLSQAASWVSQSDGRLFMGHDNVPRKFTELAASTGGAPRIGGGTSKAGATKAGSSLRVALPAAAPLAAAPRAAAARGEGGGGGGGAPASPSRGGGGEAPLPSSPSPGDAATAGVDRVLSHQLQLLAALIGADEVMKLSLGCVWRGAQGAASRRAMC